MNKALLVFIKKFISYALVGIINTLCHWLLFYIAWRFVGFSQAISNLFAFCIAVSCSYFINAKITFKTTYNKKQYFLYVFFMGMISLFIGFLSDLFKISPLITLIEFSAMSLIAGFVLSNYFIFKRV